MQASSIEGVAQATPKKNLLRLLLLPLVILAGMGLSVEAGLLGPLGEQVGHLWATLSIFGVGSAILFLLLLFSGPKKGPALTDLPRWQLIGGFLGPMYVVVLTLATPPYRHRHDHDRDSVRPGGQERVDRPFRLVWHRAQAGEWRALDRAGVDCGGTCSDCTRVRR